MGVPEVDCDLKKVLLAAAQFENCGDTALQISNLLWSRFNTTTVPNSPEAPVVAAVVNLAFALELYLKALIILDHNCDLPHENKLHVLYGQLQVGTRTRITEIYDEMVARFRPSQEAAITKHPGWKGTLKWDINSVLIESNRAFEKWRYWYEGKPLPSWFAGPVVHAARKTIVEKDESLAPIIGWKLDK
jgi:hypothetical protein